MNVIDNSYEELKEYYNTVLNKDKTTYKNSNDETTPIECIEEMIDKIPNSFFKKKDLKILDPCCGNGNFHLVIFNKLINYNNYNKIIEDVLYFNDTNIDRINNVKKIYKNPKNITNENFLTINYNTKFDAIIANPPYAKLMIDGKRTSKNHNFIKEFLEKSLSILKPNGYLVFITPDNWMSFADRDTIIKKLTELQIIHLNIHTAKKYFKKIGSSFTWYVIENIEYYKDVNIEGIYKNKNYKSIVPSNIRNYIPLFYTKEIHSILQKTIDCNIEKFNIETTSYLHKTTKKEYINNVETSKFKYKLIHTPKQTVWSSKPHKFQEGYKVFISLTDKYSVFIDNCGMTQSIAFIRCDNKENAEEIMKILNHSLYIFINNICRWGNFNNVRILQQFPIPNNKDDIFDSFNITKIEQELIFKKI